MFYHNLLLRQNRTKSDFHNVSRIERILDAAGLPLNIIRLAIGIIKDVSENFFNECKMRFNPDQSFELIIFSALVNTSNLRSNLQMISQKYFQDAIYIISTWTQYVLKDLHKLNLSDQDVVSVEESLFSDIGSNLMNMAFVYCP